MNTSEVMNIIGNVEGKTCILIDDMIDTAGTICPCGWMLLQKLVLLKSMRAVLTLSYQAQQWTIFKISDQEAGCLGYNLFTRRTLD